MAETVHTSAIRYPRGIIAVLCLWPWGVSTAAPASAPPISRQIEQQRDAQAEFRRALEDSQRRIAADQVEQLRRAQERSEQQRRALAEAERRREAEQREEELLVQARARAQQSNSPQPRDRFDGREMSQEAAGPPPPVTALGPLPRRYLFMR
jgi:hypothetical protein